MINDSLREEIRNIYLELTDSMKLRPRWGQRQMIAEVANALADSEAQTPIAVVEAGTGTGKTLAYLSAVLPIARARGKKIILASATVALQEQLLLRDLPDVLRHSGLSFDACLAKGRGRYVCLLKLDQRLAEKGMTSVVPLYPDEELPADREQAVSLFEEMIESLATGDWDGDFDSWAGSSVNLSVRRMISTDQRQCTGRLCPHVSQCSFFRAREGLQEADIIVSNQDLVLSDLRLGGGMILPPPEDCLYVFDEAHQLPAKCLSHFAFRFHASSVVQNLQNSEQWILDGCAQWLKLGVTEQIVKSLPAALVNLLQLHEDIIAMCWQQFEGMKEDPEEHRFPHGRVPDEISSLARLLVSNWDLLRRETARLESALENLYLHSAFPEKGNADLDLLNVQALGTQAQQQSALWGKFSNSPGQHEPSDGWARWFQHRGNTKSLECWASPILAGDLLSEVLWKRAAGAVVTSATLTALGTFEQFKARSGIPDSARWKQVSSPFDPAKAIFCVPSMTTEPSNRIAHTNELIRLIPDLIRSDTGVLLLFTSRKQMDDVVDGLEGVISHHMLVQGRVSKKVLLEKHRDYVDQGETSAIFGLASFFEGIDMPGEYCCHVLIAKIPFPVPGDPIASAHAELLEAEGRDPFMEISVPDAAQKLVQASGRLLRTETDKGRITLFDKRLLTRRYGRAILETLPGYTLKLNEPVVSAV